MTAVTMQSNKIVLNEVKDNYALLEPSYRKNVMDIWANPILIPTLLYTFLHPDFFISSPPVHFIPGIQQDSQAIVHDPGI